MAARGLFMDFKVEVPGFLNHKLSFRLGILTVAVRWKEIGHTRGSGSLHRMYSMSRENSTTRIPPLNTSSM